MNLPILEQSVLGALVADASILNLVNLSADDFQIQYHAQVYNQICSMVEKKITVDVVSIADALPGAGHMARLIDMMQSPITVKSAQHYADRIREERRVRRAKEVLTNALESVVDEESISTAIRELMGLQGTQKNYLYSANAIVSSAVNEIEAAMDGKLAGIKSGLSDLDRLLGGFHNSDLVILGARPSVGKTAMLANLAINANKPALLISAEQGVSQMGARLLAVRGNISVRRMRDGTLDEDDFAKVGIAGASIASRNIWIYDKPAPTVEEVCRVARKQKHNEGMEVIFVDYLQRLKGKGQDRRNEVANAVMAMKELARELDVPVICLAQVSREVEKRADKRPTMADLKEAGEIEQEADQIIMLYRDEVYNDDTADKGVAELDVVKNRHGPTATVRVLWDGISMRFLNFHSEAV